MIFATEFPVKGEIGRPEFFAQATAWVKGMEHSTLFHENRDIKNIADEASITSPSGESLILKQCNTSNGAIYGVRHEISDDEGRTWRSEVTLRTNGSMGALRTKTQCTISSERAKLQTPRKPYFVTLAIDDEWAAPDGPFRITRDANLLSSEDIDLAAAIVEGTARHILPIVYISRTIDHKLPISDSQISALANRLSGVAHVVVEPSRRFSIQLVSRTFAANPYLGAIGICVSGFGVVNKFFLGHTYKTADAIYYAVHTTIERYVSNRLPQIGADWSDIVDEITKQLRYKAEKSEEDREIWYRLRDEENAEKDALILELKEEIERLQSEKLKSSSQEAEPISSAITGSFGPELYKGELRDRIRWIVAKIASGDLRDVDPRTRLVAEHVVASTQWSGGANQLEARIKAAGRDSSKSDARIGEILTEIGFQSRRQGGHPVYTAEKLKGVPQQTLSSSSSDQRAGKNAAQQIIRDLGISAFRA